MNICTCESGSRVSRTAAVTSDRVTPLLCKHKVSEVTVIETTYISIYRQQPEVKEIVRESMRFGRCKRKVDGD